MGSLPSDVTTSVEKSAFLMNSKTVKSNMFYRGIAAGSILQNIFAINVTKNSVKIATTCYRVNQSGYLPTTYLI